MNVFGVGPAELVVVLVIALIFVGPERLPRLAADIARTIREIRKYTGGIAAELTEVLQDIERESAEDRSRWKEIGEGLTDATKSLTEALRGARADLEEPPPAPAEATSAERENGAGPAGPAWRDIAAPAPVAPPEESQAR